MRGRGGAGTTGSTGTARSAGGATRAAGSAGSAGSAGATHRALLLIHLAKLADDLVVVLHHFVAALRGEGGRLVFDHGAHLRARLQVTAQLADELLTRSTGRLQLAERRRHGSETDLAGRRREQLGRALGLLTGRRLSAA